ncbi:MAG TPA: NUMOD3 domain-containing DNA-binding protein [Aggregatilineaceae bacterium]|nr:NUMOD3 domain-containing DNA-binding protein [Aggregatilineaceae bacterium]
MITPESPGGAKIRYVKGHGARGKPKPNKGKGSTPEERSQRFFKKRKAEIEQMPKIPCECGCGEMIAPIGVDGRKRRFVFGHATRGKKTGKPSWNRLGDKPLTKEEAARRSREKRWARIEAMPKIPCACGCGEMIPPFTKEFQPATYKRGHNPYTENRYRWTKETTPRTNYSTRKGQKLSAEEIARRTETRRKNTGGRYTVGGWKHKPETLQKYSIAVRKRDLTGERNPFWGKTHTPETRQLISERNSGSNSPAWKGGISCLPYGPGFTRKFKRLIRERDNFTCQRCGITEAEYGRTLPVHHLDHDKNNNDPTNLVTACPKCNVWASYHRDEPFRPV